MLKFSKKTDYGLIALKHLAMQNGEGSYSAADIAEAYGISTPLMAKVLQKLAKGGWLRRGTGRAGDIRWRATPRGLRRSKRFTRSKGRCLSLPA